MSFPSMVNGFSILVLPNSKTSSPLLQENSQCPSPSSLHTFAFIPRYVDAIRGNASTFSIRRVRNSFVNLLNTSNFNNQLEFTQSLMASYMMSFAMFNSPSTNSGVQFGDMIMESRSTGHWIELTYRSFGFVLDLAIHVQYTTSRKNGKYHRRTFRDG